MRGTRLGIALVAIVSASCGMVATQPVVYGPYPSEPEAALFARVEERVRARGYTVLDPDPDAGQFAVRSTQRSNAGRAIFRFRFYRGGWVRVEVTGGGAHRTCEGRLVMPAHLHAEYAALVDGLLSAPEEDR